ncbi:hypothetical protein POTOM_030688 [Populus tomentosa]|uniref:Uncharacterized protein n=1 Tax=Populus tomentosa TaxID=118781 RepID=A0A8X8CU19_POPTO|nr:hypothetical protein POTOM_030688 [Populus tomentosa]
MAWIIISPTVSDWSALCSVPQSSRLLPLSLPTYVALHRQRSKSLLPPIQLKRSHEESVQEGIRFHQLFFETVPVSSPSIQASEVSVSSPLSLSPTIRDRSGVVIVSSSSCLDGFGVEYFAGEEPISGAVFVTPSGPTELTTVAINWVFDLIAGFHGPEQWSFVSFSSVNTMLDYWQWLAHIEVRLSDGLLSIVAGSLELALQMFQAQRNNHAVCSWLLEFILVFACFAAAICRFSLLLFATGVVARSLGSYGDYPHYALYVDVMDSINLGEVLSPNAWTTDVVSSIAALLAFLVRLKEIERSFPFLVHS